MYSTQEDSFYNERLFQSYFNYHAPLTFKYLKFNRTKGVTWLSFFFFFFFFFLLVIFPNGTKKGKQRDESNIFDDNKMSTAIKDAKTIQIVSFSVHTVSPYMFFPYFLSRATQKFKICSILEIKCGESEVWQ